MLMLDLIVGTVLAAAYGAACYLLGCLCTLQKFQKTLQELQKSR